MCVFRFSPANYALSSSQRLPVTSSSPRAEASASADHVFSAAAHSRRARLHVRTCAQACSAIAPHPRSNRWTALRQSGRVRAADRALRSGVHRDKSTSCSLARPLAPGQTQTQNNSGICGR